MPIKSRGSGWQADFTHKGKRYRRQFSHRVEAEAWEKDSQARLLRGELVDIGTNAPSVDSLDTLESLKDATYNRHWVGLKAEEHLLRNAEQVVEILGPRKHPKEITEKSIDSLVGTLSGAPYHYSGATINRKLAALSKMLRHGQSRGIISRVPTIERRKESEHRTRWLSDEEEQAVLAYFNLVNPEMADLVIVLLNTGARLSNALALTADEINGDVGTFWKTKSGRPYSVPLTARVKEVLDRRSKGGGRLFTLTKDQAEHFWSRMRESLGLEDDDQFVIHMLRHTFGSRLVQKGVDIRTVRDLMGHSSILTTMKYAHLNPKDLKDAIRVLERKAA